MKLLTDKEKERQTNKIDQRSRAGRTFYGHRRMTLTFSAMTLKT